MIDIFTGFAVVVAAVGVGYVIARFGVIGPESREVLSTLVFFVLSPLLLFTILSTADVTALFSTLLPVSAIAAVAVMAIYALISLVVWRRDTGDTVIGVLAAGYVNAGNMGIPIAAYVLGDAALAAPVTLVQLLIFMPVAFSILDASSGRRLGIGRVLLRTLRNPMLIGSALGVLVSISGISLTPLLAEPIRTIGQACIPIMLISYGISLHGRRVLTTTGRRRDVVLASALTLFAMPLIAAVVGTWIIPLSPEHLLAVTVLAALPTAQNVFTYAQRYRRGEVIARDTIFVTTVCSLPIILVVTLLLRPSS